MQSSFIHRYLDPADSLGELLFGLIMSLTFTLGARILSQRPDIDPHELVLALIGCNVAWGIIDGVLYLLGSVFSRNMRIQFVRRLKAAKGEAEAMAIIREEFGLEDEPNMSAEDRAAFHRVIFDIMGHASTKQARLRYEDIQAAAVIAVLVSLVALPGILPFLFLDDGYLALRLANFIQIVLLFLIGYRWARHTGANPWRTGLGVVALGVTMVLVAIALGG
jgi:VIT1/CCC1 family predicted Fe2+/Mn2+ transporter